MESGAYTFDKFQFICRKLEIRSGPVKEFSGHAAESNDGDVSCGNIGLKRRSGRNDFLRTGQRHEHSHRIALKSLFLFGLVIGDILLVCILQGLVHYKSCILKPLDH